MLLRGPSVTDFDQSICRTKEQKARLQCLAIAMPKSVMPSGAKNGKVSQEKKRKNMAVIATVKHCDWNVFFFSKAFKQRQNSGVNRSTWKCRWRSRHKFRSTFHTQPGWPYWHTIFRWFRLQSLVSAYCSGECCFLPSHSLACGNIFS